MPNERTPLLVVIPGDQSSALKQQGTARFREALALPHLCLAQPGWSRKAVRALIAEAVDRELVVIAFSAGVVGAAAALTPAFVAQHRLQVRALLALDGWLVPLFVPFAIYRLSHDRFTHATSRPFGMGKINFYAEPPVPHLDLWAAPALARGYAETPDGLIPSDALTFIRARLAEHGIF